MTRIALTLVKLMLLAVLPLAAEPSYAKESLKAPHIAIDWLSPETFPATGETLIGIRFRPETHWHVYWKNPGDSGAAPKFAVQAQGAEVSEPLWPYPTRQKVAHLTNLGYDGKVAYLFRVKTKDASAVKLKVNLDWLVCQDACVPGTGELTLERPAQGENATFAPETEADLNYFANRIPEPSSSLSYQYTLSIRQDANGAQVLVVNINGDKLPQDLNLFPVDGDFVLPAQPQTNITETAAEFIFQTSPAPQPEKFNFVMLASEKAYDLVDLKLNGAFNGKTTLNIAETSALALFFLVLSAFVGGILLNLMPCVFPVISMKAVSLLKTTDIRARKRDGIMYTLGVLTTFTALGVVFLVLRNLGSAVGWGFQLQSPLVVFTLIVLFWLMALNFLGAFEFGTSVMNKAGGVNWRSSFGTGVLSVFIAAPCTGPFMGTALGATATLPNYQAILVFIALGAGLAIPYLLLTLSNRVARWLPKPGAWMETLKQFFAFPLFATVLWLIWVLGQQANAQGWMISATALLSISFALWLGQRRSKFWFVMGWFFGLSMIAYSAQQLRHLPEASENQTQTHNGWQSYDEAKLQAALQSGQPVFVDFTAAWCITCQVNKKVVLETAAATKFFEEQGILRMRADWTNQNPMITAALARLGRNSVPVYAYYSKIGSEPVILPQLLTIDMIHGLKTTQPKETK